MISLKNKFISSFRPDTTATCIISYRILFMLTLNNATNPNKLEDNDDNKRDNDDKYDHNFLLR